MTVEVESYCTVVRPNFGYSRRQRRGDRVIRGRITVDPQIVETALGVDRAAIAALSDAELLVLADAVGLAIGEEFVKVSDRERAVERKLTNELDDEYVEGVDLALDAELSGLPADDVAADEAVLAVSGVGSRLERDLEGDRGTRMRDALLAALAAFTLTGRKSGKTLVGESGRSTSSISGSLTSADRGAVAALADQQLWWIGRFWGEHLSKTISATITREAVVGGLGREEVGRIVRGVVGGTFPGVGVPGTWSGSTEQYFTSLAGTVRNQASNYGVLTTFVEGGVERYRIVAVLDKRTSDVCRLMDGREFSVRTGAKLAADRLDADSPEAVKNVSPWRSATSAETIAGAENPEEALSRAGMALPPYHGSCRSSIAPA